MKHKSSVTISLALVFMCMSVSSALAIDPVTPNASPEAKALLDLFYRISGKYTLTGQHNYPATRDHNTRFFRTYTGQLPVVWSSDMGFAKEGDTDSYLARPDIVKEAIRQHKKGSIITLCWHAVPPTANEPVTFQPQRKMPPDSLASVQGQLTDAQFIEVLTPGTRLYKNWAAQVDSVAVWLKKLQEAKVPVLWRPYHEMNGDWFWWGGRVGEYSTEALYRQLWDRYVKVHKLTNLVWVWSVDRPSTPIRKFSNFYPGNQYLDILSLDVYGSDFNQAYYDSLKVLSQGKPLTLAEVGNPPSPEVIKNQPGWTWWVIWAGMVRNTTKIQYKELLGLPQLLTQEDQAFYDVMNPYRKACGLPLLPLKEKYPVNFSGIWMLDEAKSDFGQRGSGNAPYKLEITQEDDQLLMKRYTIVEWGDDRVSSEEFILDGSEIKSVFFNSPRTTKATLDTTGVIKIVSVTKMTRGGNSVDMKSTEEWSLQQEGKQMTIRQTSPGFRGGETTTVMVFEKR
jgi:mannan endo-1,4-beta-mannosidase